ncbi:LAME_0H02894g1_1 [Lachancea meyersii CBS 8951]|uniref:LAME_0H02894g1_1 n=1 Tax=Lachancea meyersii CBS 8951 TaxID=1266667 RepID=A0A1G4KDH9_9SACH|nr:LAME_0H02894g1_1 [Lachancea meyersii CBS 8951]
MLRLSNFRFPAFQARNFTACSAMRSGHNKWSTIKHDKAKNDAERNKLFNKFANQIALAVKLGGGSTDPALNVRLAAAIEGATKNNVTKRVIENAIRKGSGATGKDGNRSEACTYEGMGPGGVAFVVEALTDNKNRTIGLVRSTFTKVNGSMTPTLYFFDRKGSVLVQPPATLVDFDAVMEKVLELEGVEDLETMAPEEPTYEALKPDYGSTVYEVSSDPALANHVASSLKDLDFYVHDVNIGYQPKSDMLVEVANDETRSKIDKFMGQLDEIDDVTDFYCNLKI